MPNLERFDGNEPGPLAQKLKEFMLERIVSQDRAINDLAAAVDLYESGFRDSDRPIYSLLFLGPSGVGKTLTAEVLAEFFFGHRQAFTKVACADYQEQHAIARLIGSPPGYVGFFNPKDKQYPGVEPIFSQSNIDKHDFHYQQGQVDGLLKNLRALKEKEEALRKIFNKELTARSKKLEEFKDKLAEEFRKIENQICKQISEIEAELAKLEGQETEEAAQKIRELKQKKEELENQFLQESVNLETRIGEEKKKAEPELQKVIDAIKKNQEKQDELIKEGKSRLVYSPDKNYRSIILFDEIEKANMSLLRLLLEILDKGRLTMSNGAITRMTNSFIILTSNIGSLEIARILTRSDIGFKPVKEAEIDTDQEIYKAALAEATKILPPEFRGRLGNTIVFHPLTREALEKILDIQIHELYDMLIKINLPIVLQISAEVKEFIINEATDRLEYGARLLKNKLKKYVIEPLSRLKNRGKIRAGDTIYLDLLEENGKKNVYFRREPPSPNTKG